MRALKVKGIAAMDEQIRHPLLQALFHFHPLPSN
jgi:hypothetical protein